jgi:hypothetical protein
MPKIGLKSNTELQTRNAYTKVGCEISVIVDGKELPSMGVVGEALEKAIELFQNEIKKSYEVVPVRVDTPMAEPYVAKPLGQ